MFDILGAHGVVAALRHPRAGALSLDVLRAKVEGTTFAAPIVGLRVRAAHALKERFH